MLHKVSAISWFENIGRADVPTVGGKNASLGEMVRTLAADGINVPPGFATTADVYWRYVDANGLRASIAFMLADWDAGRTSLADAGRQIRSMFLKGSFPLDMAKEITRAYRKLSERAGVADVAVAVRSSATAEDLPDASFAGQQETFLNIRGEAAVLNACRRCFASLFTDRAISYRKAKRF